MELLVFAVLTLAAVITGAGQLHHRHSRWLARTTGQRLLVHTREGQTLDGRLEREGRDGLLLTRAKLADEGLPIDGHAWIPRDRIAWVQAPRDSDERPPDVLPGGSDDGARRRPEHRAPGLPTMPRQ